MYKGMLSLAVKQKSESRALADECPGFQVQKYDWKQGCTTSKKFVLAERRPGQGLPVTGINPIRWTGVGVEFCSGSIAADAI